MYKQWKNVSKCPWPLSKSNCVIVLVGKKEPPSSRVGGFLSSECGKHMTTMILSLCDHKLIVQVLVLTCSDPLGSRNA